MGFALLTDVEGAAPRAEDTKRIYWIIHHDAGANLIDESGRGSWLKLQIWAAGGWENGLEEAGSERETVSAQVKWFEEGSSNVECSEREGVESKQSELATS